jgi:hypothetical protein
MALNVGHDVLLDNMQGCKGIQGEKAGEVGSMKAYMANYFP